MEDSGGFGFSKIPLGLLDRGGVGVVLFRIVVFDRVPRDEGAGFAVTSDCLCVSNCELYIAKNVVLAWMFWSFVACFVAFGHVFGVDS